MQHPAPFVGLRLRRLRFGTLNIREDDMNTCDTCKHYREPIECEIFSGDREYPLDSEAWIAAFDWNGEPARIQVYPKFGCIHWMAKEAE
jgi:hypothetical protein